MTVRFWDVESGKQNESIPLQIRLAGLAWSQDGRYLAAPERGRAFWVWNVEQHKQRTTFYGNLVRVRALAFTPDSGTLFSANEAGSVQFWDMPSGQCIRNWLAFALTVHEVAWSPNGAQLAGGGNEGIITIWDVARRVPLHLMMDTR
jgi:WD40 repeat protein